MSRRIKLVCRPEDTFSLEVADLGGYRVRHIKSGLIWWFCETYEDAKRYVHDLRAGKRRVWSTR